jgi:GNAT superfamily N-acetyltransferase
MAVAFVDIEVSESPRTNLAEYATIPIAFQVRSVFDVIDRRAEHGEFVLVERDLRVHYLKDYDAIEGNHPIQWATRFDVSNWGFLAADVAGRRVGWAAVAIDTPSLDILQGRADIAAAWDIRVAPKVRGLGIGSELFHAAVAWARARGCRQLVIETQNINVPACRFYLHQGCVLVAANQLAYPGFPDETQLLWQKAL